LLRLDHGAYSQVGQGSAGTVLVVTRTGLEDGLGLWVTQRESQGYRVVVNAWSERPEPFEITAWIRRFQNGLSSILIAGDCSADFEASSPWDIPSIHRENSYGSFVSDALYGDVDGDGVPEVPVGRLPARNGDQLQKLAAKSLHYEGAGPGKTGHDVIVWAASEQFFNVAVKAVAQVRQKSDADIDIRLVGPEPSEKKAPQTFLALAKRSPAFSIIAAHGSFRSVVSGSRPVSDPEEFRLTGLTVEDVLAFQAPSPSGPLFLLSCDSGQFNLSIEKGLSLAEAFLQADGGPACVIAASGIMEPPTNIRIADALAGQVDKMPQTAGALLLQIQMAILSEKRKEKNSGQQMATLSGIVSESDDILLYNLIGDPTCRIRI